MTGRGELPSITDQTDPVQELGLPSDDGLRDCLSSQL